MNVFEDCESTKYETIRYHIATIQKGVPMQENLSLYHIFYTVARTGNISGAAKELFISQPAISKSIRKLEENLNTILFLRNSRGVTLTRDGELLYTHVRSAFDSLSLGEQLLARNHELGISQLRIGASTTLSKYVLLPRLKTFIRQHPNVKVTITCQSTHRTLALLEEQKIDVGLVGKPKAVRGYSFLPVQTIQDTFAASPSYLEHLFVRTSPEHLFEAATFMLMDEENITRQYVNSQLREHHIELSNILEVSTMDLLIEFARIGLGIGCVIRDFVLQDLQNKTLQEVHTGVTFPKREIGIAFRREHQSLPVIQNFLKTMSPSEI